MGATKPKEQRFFPRYLSVSKAFQGRFLRAGRDLGAQVLDVSRDGLGVLLSQPVEAGETLELLALERQLTFQVVHCNEDLVFRGKYRCGLRRTGSAENLVSLFLACGMIDGD